jgi:small-conductance mechanosensitive channel
MDGVFDYRLFRIGDTTVTLASLVAAIVVLIAAYVVGRLARRLVSDRLLARTRLSVGVRYMLGRFTGYVVFVLGAIMALQTIGIRATTLTAFGAALGVGIGFGLQDIVKNFVAGLVILIERPFEVGDRIEIDKMAAEVAEIRSRATVLRTNDDVHLIVPNSRFIQDTIVNRSYDRPLYRCHTPVSVDNASDPRIATDALLDAARRTDGVLKEPPPSVRFRGFGSDGMKLELLCWTDKMAHRPGALVSALNFEIFDALKRSGIRLPQTEIRVLGADGVPGPAAAGPGMEAADTRPREVQR